MKIPKEFNIMNHTVKVKMVDYLKENFETIGLAKYDQNEILLQKGHKHMVETFIHEFLHWVFFVLDENQINDNEKLINQMSGLIEQSLRSMKF